MSDDGTADEDEEEKANDSQDACRRGTYNVDLSKNDLPSTSTLPEVVTKPLISSPVKKGPKIVKVSWTITNT